MARLEFTEVQMQHIVDSGSAQILFRDAAEEEYGKHFKGVRSNQQVGCVVTFFKKTRRGFVEIRPDEIKDKEVE